VIIALHGKLGTAKRVNGARLAGYGHHPGIGPTIRRRIVVDSIVFTEQRQQVDASIARLCLARSAQSGFKPPPDVLGVRDARFLVILVFIVILVRTKPAIGIVRFRTSTKSSIEQDRYHRVAPKRYFPRRLQRSDKDAPAGPSIASHFPHPIIAWEPNFFKADL
jgi:hypothetical protein